MKPQEAIELVEQCGLNIEGVKSIECECLIISALEKQIPKKPLKKSLANNGCAWEWTCPNCRIVKVTTEKQFCDDCGQALDWGDKK